MNNFFKYLQFLPLLMQLVDFIRQAEATFKGPGTGASKLDYVSTLFAAVVQQAQAAGVVSPKLATALTVGAASIISIVVQIMNVTGGVKPAEPPAPTAFPYNTVLATEPTDTLLKNNDEVFSNGGEWWVRYSAFPATPPPGFVLIRTVRK